MTINLENTLMVFGAIACVGGGLAYVVKLINFIKKPNDNQNKAINEHQETLKKHQEMLDADNERLNELEKQDRLVMQALFALLSHGIDGNDVDAMKQCKENIQQYLILK